jgi:tripartite-type tricarboxylate transporter receptor subunit TctC
MATAIAATGVSLTIPFGENILLQNAEVPRRANSNNTAATPQIAMGDRMVARRLWSIISIAALLALSLSTPSLAQGYPDHVIKVVVPYGPGFVADTMARIIADRLSPQLKQPIIVENRPGAGGVLGTDYVVKSNPDGYTLLSHTMAALGPTASTNMPYDPLRDLAGVAPVASVSGILVASKTRGFKTLQELIAYGKQNPGALNFASLGPGSPSHIYAEKLMRIAGFEAVPISYKGPAEAMTDLIAGRVDFFALTVATALPYVRDGKLTPWLLHPQSVRLSLRTFRRRSRPECPTRPWTQALAFGRREGHPHPSFKISIGRSSPSLKSPRSGNGSSRSAQSRGR